jgi:peptide-methionine (S)-S-oxide reductase
MRKLKFLALGVFAVLAVAAVQSAQSAMSKPNEGIMNEKPMDKPTAVFAGGCFWCTESEFRAQPGVLFTRVGYAGGTEPNPTYEMVSHHQTGHAESTEVTYDPKVTSFENLTEYFLTKAHDPTQLNRQGPDVGSQYRSAIFYSSAEEKAIAEKVIARVTAAKVWNKPIVTTIEPLTTFWEAEGYHQQYYEKFEAKYGVPHINNIVRAKPGIEPAKLND